MASMNTLTEFNAASETWDSYITRFECFLEANDYTRLSESRKRACFLNLCGREMFNIAGTIVVPQSVHNVPWEVLMAKLKNHYAPAPSHIAWRHAFHRRNQREGEPLNDYIAALRVAALFCEFWDLDDILLDQIVTGV